jgi:phospholipase C
MNPKLITRPSLGQGIATNRRHIFFTDGDGISRASRDGTNIVAGIVKGLSPLVLAADIGHVYWQDNKFPPGPISRANFDGTGVEIQFVEGVNRLYGFAVAAIEYVFVLMLENRSFDHMLGGLNIEGVDAVTGKPTKVNGVDRETVNYLGGTQPFPAHSPAPEPMPADPPHEYPDTMSQLATKKFNWQGKSGSLVNGGFVDAYNEVIKQTEVKPSPGDVMANCDKSQIPVLYRLATEFAVCDNWFGSVPGPTVPNRLFAMAGSSGGIDFSPAVNLMIAWGMRQIPGLRLQKGTIFDQLSRKGYKYDVYIDGWPYSLAGKFPVAAILQGVGRRLKSGIPIFKGVSFTSTSLVSQLGDKDNEYPNAFSWIEPNYGFQFKNGQSQHPCDDLAAGEELIATVYNALRNSDIWERSALIITYDEHGGFYDHVVPPKAPPPGDVPAMKSKFGCPFDQCGPRAPAVIVSPFIAKNTIDHSVYDHSSILKGTEDVLGLQPLTNRDLAALSPSAAFSLSTPRTDCPTSIKANKRTAVANDADTRSDDEPLPPPGMLDVMLYVAAKVEIELAGDNESKKRDAVSRVEAVRTIGEARSYLEAVAAMMNTEDGQP